MACIVYLQSPHSHHHHHHHHHRHRRLEEFKKLNPPLDLVKGAEMELTIRGDTLLYKNAMGGVGTIRSEIFTAALCDVFYGDDAVSPTHKEAVLAGVPKL